MLPSVIGGPDRVAGLVPWLNAETVASPGTTAYASVVARAALGARHLGPEPRHQRITRIARHVDDRLVSAGIVETERDQVMHTLPPHIGEVHWRAGRGGSQNEIRCSQSWMAD
jgi:hypothetical protein